ncbi:MAG: condensation domain-containing protein, partial [Thermoanaerobaculia bacterium]
MSRGDVRKNIEDIYKLSPMQQGMLLHTVVAPEDGAYFDQFVIPLAGPIDAEKLRSAWQQVVDRHGVLRTSFLWQDLDEPVQIVHRKVEVPFRVVDWSHLPDDDQRQGLAEFCEEDRRRGFDLSRAPLLRVTLIRLGDA